MSLFDRLKKAHAPVSKNPPNKRTVRNNLQSTWKFLHMPRTSSKYGLYEARQKLRGTSKDTKTKRNEHRSNAKALVRPIIMKTDMVAM